MKLGEEVEITGNTQDALRKFIDNRARVCCEVRYKLVIIDLDLQDDEGFELTQKIIEHQVSVKPGKSQEQKKQLQNNFFGKSVQGS